MGELLSTKWSSGRTVLNNSPIEIHVKMPDFKTHFLCSGYICDIQGVPKKFIPPNEICLSIFKYILNLFHYISIDRPKISNFPLEGNITIYLFWPNIAFMNGYPITSYF